MKLSTLQIRFAELAAKIAEAEATRDKELRDLPALHGYRSMDDLIVALRHAERKRKGRKPSRGATGGDSKGGKRRRATITDAVRAEVKKLVSEGKTGTQIAKAVGISLPSVQKIKKAAGLVKARK